MVVRDAGSVRDVREVQLSKAFSPMSVREALSGKVRAVRDVQFAKAEEYIPMREAGRVRV
jgi:hypothetical protein